MDFGWKKADPVTDDQTTNSNNQVATSVVSQSQTTTPAVDETKKDEPLTVPENIAPVAEEKAADTTPAKDDAFEMIKKDDAFSNDFTMDTSATDSLPQDSNSEADSLSSGLPSDNDFRDPMTPIDEVSANENESKEPEEEKEAPVPIVEEKTDTSSSSILTPSGSLDDLEKKVADQKKDLDKQLSDLQAKVEKLNELSSKILKMRNEEQSLIQEISSSL